MANKVNHKKKSDFRNSNDKRSVREDSVIERIAQTDKTDFDDGKNENL